MNRIIATHLSGQRGGRDVIKDISFRLHDGEGLFVLGANGAGKSTLLSLIAGVLRQSSGTIQFLDENDSTSYNQFHFITTQNCFKSQLTVLENLQFWQRLNEKACDEQIHHALEKFDLLHTLYTPFGYLSTGQKRRASLARLLCIPKPIWILDEPTSGLDEASTHMFAQLTEHHVQQGGIFIIATHTLLQVAGAQYLKLGEV